MSHADEDIRCEKRFQDFEKSCLLLERTLEIPSLSELERAGLVHFFELTYELAWRFLKNYLEGEGFDPTSPKETFQLACQSGLIEQEQAWIDAMNDRALTNRIYEENIAVAIEANIRRDHFPFFDSLCCNLKDRM